MGLQRMRVRFILIRVSGRMQGNDGGLGMYWLGVVIDLLGMGLFMYWVIIQPEKGA